MNLIGSVHCSNISETSFQQYSKDAVIFTSCEDNITKESDVLLLQKNVKKLENDLNYLEKDHKKVLQGLQHEIELLRETNQDLQFELVMRSNRHNISGGLSSTQHSESNMKTAMDFKKLFEEEKAKNQKLIFEISKLTKSADNTFKPDNSTSTSVSLNETIEVDSHTRITLDPLRIVEFSKDIDSIVLRKPTLDECQIIIGTLLTWKNKQEQTQEKDDISEKTINSRNKTGLLNNRKLTPKLENPNSSTPNNSNSGISSRRETISAGSGSSAIIKLSPIVNPPKLDVHNNSSEFHKYPVITGPSTSKGHSGQSQQQNPTRIISPLLMNCSSNESINSYSRSLITNPYSLLPISNITAPVPTYSASNKSSHAPDIRKDTGTINKVLLPAQPRPNISSNQAERKRRLQSIQKNRINQLQDKF